MSEIQEQTQLAVEIQDQISSGPIGADLDEVRYFLADRRDPHPLFFIGRVEEGAGGPRTRPAERYAEGCGARTDTPATRGCETHRGYVVVMLATAREDIDRVCSEGYGGDGRGRDAEAITSRACDVTSLSVHSFRFGFSYTSRSRYTAHLSFPLLCVFLSVVMNLNLSDTLRARVTLALDQR